MSGCLRIGLNYFLPMALFRESDMHLSEIRYAVLTPNSQLIPTSLPLYFHLTRSPTAVPLNRNFDYFTIIFLSFSKLLSENLESWGDTLSKILQIKSGSVQVRIENCNLVNFSAKVAREFASGCDLDPLGTLRLIHRVIIHKLKPKLRNGNCLMMRLSTTQALFAKLCDKQDILGGPYVFYSPQLDGLYNRLEI